MHCSISIRKKIVLYNVETYRKVTPSAVQTGNPIVTFNLFSAFRTFSMRVSLNPMVNHLLSGS